MIINNKTSITIFGVLLFLLALHAINHPKYNWDMLGYVASAKTYSTDNHEYIHEYTYGGLSATLPERKVQHLVDGGIPYNQEMARNADAFNKQLPFYQIRVAYNSILASLISIGINPYFATHLIATIFTLIGLLFVLRIFQELKASTKVTAFIPVTAALFGASDIARLSTPDSLAFMAISGISLLIIQKRFTLVLTLLPFLVLLRTDLILFTLMLCLYSAISIRSIKLFIPLLSGALSLIVYFALNNYFENHGWGVVFYFTFIEHITDPTLVPNVTPAIYFDALINGLKNALRDIPFIIYLLASAYLIYLHVKTTPILDILSLKLSPVMLIHYLGVAYVLAHFILFPVTWERFFVAQYLFTIILTLNIMGKNALQQFHQLNRCRS